MIIIDFILNLFNNTYYFLFGCFFSLFVLILLRGSKQNDSYINDINSCDNKFYLNIFFLNRKEVLENIVRSKVSRKRPVLRALAKRVAVNLVSDSTLVDRIGNDLVTTIPYKLGLTGVRASANIVYKQSAYFIVEVNLLSLDLIKVVEVNAGKEKSISLQRFFDRIDIPQLLPWIESWLISLLLAKVKKMLPLTIKEKLQDKLIAEVEIITLSDSEQGPFLLQTIQNINESSKVD